MSANAKFPQGFVCLPMHHRSASTGNDGGSENGQDGVNYLNEIERLLVLDQCDRT